MKVKLAYRLLFAFTLALLLHGRTYAVNVEVIPGEVIPGDVFLLNVQADKSGSAAAEFRGGKISLYPAEEGQLIALIPVDINTPPGKYNIDIIRGKQRTSVSINVTSHEFKTIKLTLPEGKVTLSPANQRRAVKEAELLKQIWPQKTARRWSGRFTKPTDTKTSTAFGVKRIMNEKKTSVHRGMDFRGKTGTPVRAINAGTVLLTDNLFYGGNTLIVDHGMGLYSVYMHLSEFNVSKGKKVSKGQVVGFVGSSGRVTGPHLHMSVKLNGLSVNPGSLFKLDMDE